MKKTRWALPGLWRCQVWAVDVNRWHWNVDRQKKDGGWARVASSQGALCSSKDAESAARRWLKSVLERREVVDQGPKTVFTMREDGTEIPPEPTTKIQPGRYP